MGETNQPLALYSNSHKFAWFGQRALDCIGINHYFPLDMILCCDFGEDTHFIRETTKSKLLSLEELTFERENWTSAQLDSLIIQKSNEIINLITQSPTPIYIIAYSANKLLSDLVKQFNNKVHLIMPDVDLKIWLDNKYNVTNSFSQLSIPHLVTSQLPLGNLHFTSIALDIGVPFVVSLPFGSAGSGTFLIQSQETLKDLYNKFGNTPVLISKYIPGISLNINGAIAGNHVLVAQPSIQLVGLKQCSTRFGIYCGNDFGTINHLNSSIVEQTIVTTKKVGEWLKVQGFEGIFGLDYVVDMDKGIVYPVDLNPRFQNSTFLLTQAEMLDKRTPLSVLSIGWQIGQANENDLKQWQTTTTSSKLPTCAQIILHSLENNITIARNKIQPGTYSQSMDYISSKVTISHQMQKNSALIACAVPRKKTIIKPGAPLFKAITVDEVYSLDTLALKREWEDFCELAYDSLMLKT